MTILHWPLSQWPKLLQPGNENTYIIHFLTVFLRRLSTKMTSVIRAHIILFRTLAVTYILRECDIHIIRVKQVYLFV